MIHIQPYKENDYYFLSVKELVSNRNIFIGGEIRVILNCFSKFSQGQQVVCLKKHCWIQ